MILLVWHCWVDDMGGQGDDGDFIGDCWLMDGDEILFDDIESAEVLC